MNIGKAIKYIRKTKGITQTRLAELAGLSANAMCSIENDKAFPNKDTINAISKALNVSVPYLLFASITEEDVPVEKQEIFKALHKPILELFG